MERCPCCNARLTETAICPRCQADLSSVLGCEQTARQWLINAIQFWYVHESKMAILALSKSIYLKRTLLALVFRDLIIQEQCQYVLGLLEKKEYVVAKELLSMMCNLNPHHKLSRRLYSFSKYLLVKDIIEIAIQQPNRIQPTKIIDEHRTG